MTQHSEKILNTILRAAATALIGAGASLLSLVGVRAQTAPLVIATSTSCTSLRYDVTSESWITSSAPVFNTETVGSNATELVPTTGVTSDTKCRCVPT
jgi:hypothetical protein